MRLNFQTERHISDILMPVNLFFLSFSKMYYRYCQIPTISVLRLKLLISIISFHCLLSDVRKPHVKEMLVSNPLSLEMLLLDEISGNGRAVYGMSVSYHGMGAVNILVWDFAWFWRVLKWCRLCNIVTSLLSLTEGF